MKQLLMLETIGFKKIVIPSGNAKEYKRKHTISIKPIDDLLSAIEYLLNS